MPQTESELIILKVEAKGRQGDHIYSSSPACGRVGERAVSIWDRCTCKEQFVRSLVNTARDVPLPGSTARFMAVDSWKEEGCMYGAVEEGEAVPGNLDLIKLNYAKSIFNTRFCEVNFV